MNAKELLHEIIKKLAPTGPCNGSREEAESLLFAALEGVWLKGHADCVCRAPDLKEAKNAAYEEGFVKGRDQGAFECRHAKESVRKEAYEDCAKRADVLHGVGCAVYIDDKCNCISSAISKDIRLRAKELMK